MKTTISILLILNFYSVYANPVSIPHTFSNGQVADAVQINQNFDSLAVAIESSNVQSDFSVTGTANISGMLFPNTLGNPGDTLVSTGNGILFWSAPPANLQANDNVVLSGDWDNNLHPWLDSEVSDNLTIINGSISNTPISGSIGSFRTVSVNNLCDLKGGLNYSFMNVSSNGMISENVIYTFVDTSSQTVQCDLPPASTLPGRVLKVIKTAKNNHLDIFAGNGGNINSGNLLRLRSAFDQAELISNGSLWYLTSNVGSLFYNSSPQTSDFEDNPTVNPGGSLVGLTPLPYAIDNVLYGSATSIFHAGPTANAGYNAATGDLILVSGTTVTLTFPSPISEFSCTLMAAYTNDTFTINSNNGKPTKSIPTTQGVPFSMPSLVISPASNSITISWGYGEAAIDNVQWQ